jgi:hypothetical protein
MQSCMASRAECNQADVQKVLVQAMLDVQANKLAPRVGTAMAQISNALLRIMPVTELEERVARLELAATQADIGRDESTDVAACETASDPAEPSSRNA